MLVVIRVESGKQKKKYVSGLRMRMMYQIFKAGSMLDPREGSIKVRRILFIRSWSVFIPLDGTNFGEFHKDYPP